MSIERGPLLLAIARATIAKKLGIKAWTDESAPWLQEKGATFVTLMLDQELHGCIGSILPERSLLEDIKSNALSAAFHDPRFPPLTQEEFSRIAIEVSELSSLEPLRYLTEEEAVTLLRPFVDGVVLEYGWRRGTFLPQVWNMLPEPERFLAHLKVKAGLPADFWDEGIKLARYTVQKWKEAESSSSVPS